jgi:hypothetical protein
MISCLGGKKKEKKKEERWEEKKALPRISPITFHHHIYLT